MVVTMSGKVWKGISPVFQHRDASRLLSLSVAAAYRALRMLPHGQAGGVRRRHLLCVHVRVREDEVATGCEHRRGCSKQHASARLAVVMEVVKMAWTASSTYWATAS